MTNEQGTPARLENFPISFFAMVMGLAGLTLAWEKVQLALRVDLHLTPWLFLLTAAVFAVLVGLYGAKFLRHRPAVRAEWLHPVKLNFFPTISISLLLLATASLPLKLPLISEALWLIGVLTQLLLLLAVLNVWMHHEHFEIHHINPAWFIPAVGNVVVPLAGMPLGYVDVSWFFFSVGIIFWVILLVIIFYRILFHNPLDAKLMPTLFILIAPPAVGFISYMQITGSLDAFARILYNGGLFLTLLLLTQAPRFLKLNFALSWWAYSFPLAAISIATLIMYQRTGGAFYAWLGISLVALLTGVVVLLLVLTARAVFNRRVCLPGN